MKGKSKKPSKPPPGRELCSEVRIRRTNIVFMSKSGERKMSTLAAVAGGFDVTGAHVIVANVTVLPPPAAVGKTSALRVTFNPDLPGAGCSLLGTLTRDLAAGGPQVAAISVAGPTGGEIEVPLATFSGRRVGYTVTDPDPGVRTVALRIRSLDGYGVNETWHFEIAVLAPPAGVTDFKLRIGAGTVINSVNVTP